VDTFPVLNPQAAGIDVHADCHWVAVPPGKLSPESEMEPLAQMGQVLFAPPNVKGWRTGTDWLNSATLLARNNFAEKQVVSDRQANQAASARPQGPAAVAAGCEPILGPAYRPGGGLRHHYRCNRSLANGRALRPYGPEEEAKSLL
jgi:hypothetical protein